MNASHHNRRFAVLLHLSLVLLTTVLLVTFVNAGLDVRIVA